MSSFALKILAMMSMLIDHIGVAFELEMPYSVYLLCRAAGRLAMPIFCFLIAEGLFHTRGAGKYLLRLALFALVSEVPFDLLVRGEWLEYGRQNVGFTLFFGLLGVLMFDSFAAQGRKFPALFAILAAAVAATLVRSDYTLYGVYFIFIFYYFRDRPRGRAAALTAGVLLQAFDHWLAAADWRFALILAAAAAAAIPIAFYNNERGRDSRAVRAAFYAFYPLHMTLLYALTLALPPA
ncbi:MAG: conjugal transfer protein TraX [Oscillospiraceae bacterium]|nr:conjugal transfer protein TraX [Oscillospiraceae bacterium]